MFGPLGRWVAAVLLIVVGSGCGPVNLVVQRRRPETLRSIAVLRLDTDVNQADQALLVTAGCTQAIVDQRLQPIEGSWVRRSEPGGLATVGADAVIEGTVVTLPRGRRVTRIELRLVGVDGRLRSSGRFESVDGERDGFRAGRRVCRALLAVD